MRLSFFNIQKKETFNYKGNPKTYNDLNHTKNIVSFNSGFCRFMIGHNFTSYIKMLNVKLKF